MHGRICFPLAWFCMRWPRGFCHSGETVRARFSTRFFTIEPIEAVRLITAVPVALQRIIEKAMKKDRELRYNRAAELRTDLKRFKRDSSSGSYRIEAEMPARR